jgi:hypothetical protein
MMALGLSRSHVFDEPGAGAAGTRWRLPHVLRLPPGSCPSTPDDLHLRGAAGLWAITRPDAERQQYVSNLVDLSSLLSDQRLRGDCRGWIVAGAAWGTGIGFVAAFVMALKTVFGGITQAFSTWSFRDDWRPSFKILREISKVGGGAAPGAGGVPNRLLLLHGQSCANLGTAVCSPPPDLRAVPEPFVHLPATASAWRAHRWWASRWGAGRPDWPSSTASPASAWRLVVALVWPPAFVIFRRQLVGIFTDDPANRWPRGSVMLMWPFFQPFQTSSVVVSARCAARATPRMWQAS